MMTPEQAALALVVIVVCACVLTRTVTACAALFARPLQEAERADESQVLDTRASGHQALGQHPDLGAVPPLPAREPRPFVDGRTDETIGRDQHHAERRASMRSMNSRTLRQREALDRIKRGW